MQRSPAYCRRKRLYCRLPIQPSAATAGDAEAYDLGKRGAVGGVLGQNGRVGRGCRDRPKMGRCAASLAYPSLPACCHWAVCLVVHNARNNHQVDVGG